MLSDQMQDALNQQVNMELQAYYTYLSMSAYFEGMALKGFANWMFHHAEEEMSHAMKIYNFIHTRRGKVELEALAKPPHTWESPLAALEDAMAHEQKVTQAIHKIVKLAREEGDYPTDSLMQWFVDEQVEEEEVVDELIQRLKLIDNFKPGLYLLDRDLQGEAGAHAEEDEA